VWVIGVRLIGIAIDCEPLTFMHLGFLYPALTEQELKDLGATKDAKGVWIFLDGSRQGFQGTHRHFQ
jgi:hypothetical protein